MSNWAVRRQVTYASVAGAVLLLLIGIPAFFALSKPGTCTDGKRNGKERGVDCGGDCAKICTADALPLKVVWSRAFPVKNNIYSVVGYVENPNPGAAVENVTYTFTLVDDRNITIASRRGTVAVPPQQRFAIFETGVDTGKRMPARTFLEFSPIEEWLRVESRQKDIRVAETLLRDETSSPRLEATLQNVGITRFGNLRVVAILYDKNDNALGVSSTVVRELLPESVAKASFTWNSPFFSTVNRIEIIPQPSSF